MTATQTLRRDLDASPGGPAREPRTADVHGRLPRIDRMSLFAVLVAARQPACVTHALRTGYLAGTSRADHLAASEIARALTGGPGAVVAQAYATVQGWGWLAARRGACAAASPRSLASRAVVSALARWLWKEGTACTR